MVSSLDRVGHDQADRLVVALEHAQLAVLLLVASTKRVALDSHGDVGLPMLAVLLHHVAELGGVVGPLDGLSFSQLFISASSINFTQTNGK